MLAALALALAVVGAASASAGDQFRGKTKQGPKVAFRTTAVVVVGFKSSVSALCVSAVSGKSVLEVYPVLLQSPSRLTNGRFTLNFKGSSSTFITVTGRISGSSAGGRIDVRYTKTLGMTSSGLLDIGACSAHTTWTAHKA